MLKSCHAGRAGSSTRRQELRKAGISYRRAGCEGGGVVSCNSGMAFKKNFSSLTQYDNTFYLLTLNPTLRANRGVASQEFSNREEGAGVTLCQSDGIHQIVMSFWPSGVGSLHAQKNHKRRGSRAP